MYHERHSVPSSKIFQILIIKVIGIVPIWGNVNIYITSYLRAADDSITVQDTYVAFPITLLVGGVAMQIGSILIEKISPKLQMFIGTVMITASMIACSLS